MTLVGFWYDQIAWWRRRWYARHPEARRHLARPVVSVGNLSVGGTGKTPLVAALAGELLAAGERPAILSRGYRRPRPRDGIVVVRDLTGVRATVDEAGDEPLMLARALDGALVLVASDRYAAGRLAELRLGATIHLLDDGFQHLPLARDVDLLVVEEEDLLAPRVLPAGRLRERLAAAAGADAVIVPEVDPETATRLAARLGVAQGFSLRRSLGRLHWTGGSGPDRALGPGLRVLAVAGIARPERFFADLAATGATVAAELPFRDHHPFGRREVDRIVRQARAAAVDGIVTTEKDLMRLLPFAPLPVPLGWVSLEVQVEPQDAFRRWLCARLEAARAARRAGGAEARATP